MTTHCSGSWRMYGRMVILVLAILFSVGVVGHAFDQSLPLMITLTPWFLLLTSGLVIAPAIAVGGRRFVVWAAVTYAFTFLAEAVGVATGAVFGEYVYGPTLGLAWFGVPVIIAFNWVMVVHGAGCIATRLLPADAPWRRPAYILLTGVLATGFDYVLEPVAIRLDYWTWAGRDIPLQNYLAWFVIALLAAAFHPRQHRQGTDIGSACRLAAFYVILQILFFFALQQVL